MLHKLYQVTRFTPVNTVIYISIAFVLLFTQQVNFFIYTISGRDGVNSFKENVINSFDEYLLFLESYDILSAASLFIIFVVIGSLILWLLREIIEFINDFGQYIDITLHPSALSNTKISRYWFWFVIKHSLIIIGIIGLAVYFIFWYNVILPSVQLTFDLFNENRSPLVDLFISPLTLIFSLHGFTILYRMAIGRLTN